MSGIATAVIGSAVIGGVVASNAAGKAADAQQGAAQLSSDTQLKMFNQNREDATPWRDAGKVALSQLVTGTKDGGDFNRDFTMADFNADPGYQFRMQQGQQALERSAAARGGALGGGALKSLTRYGQGVASEEYGNAYNRFNNDRTTRFNRLSSLAGMGQTANSQIGDMGMQTAANVGNNQLAAGNASAAGYVGQANAVNNTIGSLTSMYALNGLSGGKIFGGKP